MYVWQAGDMRCSRMEHSWTRSVHKSEGPLSQSGRPKPVLEDSYWLKEHGKHSDLQFLGQPRCSVTSTKTHKTSSTVLVYIGRITGDCQPDVILDRGQWGQAAVCSWGLGMTPRCLFFCTSYSWNFSIILRTNVGIQVKKNGKGWIYSRTKEIA